jgi:hypothetical protein
LKKHSWFFWALLAVVLAQGLDIASTLFVMRLPGTCEMNQLVADPDTCKFLFWKGLQLKLIYDVLLLGLTWILAKVLKPTWLAALPMLFHAYETFVGPDFSNIALFWRLRW